jgi:glycolate oxidase FAD binding subunit
VIPRGGGGHSGLGNAPARHDIALDMTALNSIVDYEPGDLTLTCGAGITLGELRRAAAAAGQMVAFDPAIPDEATAGGVLAADVWGAARLSLGAPRDFTIGLRVITGDEVIARAGGRVVKNVAGYDLCKLYIGSLGTLAVITEATFKVQPLPRTTREVTLAFDTATEACRAANDALMRGLSLRSAVLSRAETGWQLAVTLAGPEAAVERSDWELGRDRRRETKDRARPPTGEIIVRLGVLPSELPALLADLPADVPFEAYPTLGVVRLRLSDAAALEPLLARGAVVEAAPVDVKRSIDVFGGALPSLPLMRSVKAALDPNGVLSPGRFAGRL